MRFLVTGAKGSVGEALVPRLDAVCATDVDTVNVTRFREVERTVRAVRPDVIYHLAGAKHAPEGETDPANVARVNIDGTLNVLRAAGAAKVIVASTCKACDPETAYGASKLIAERATLNAGGIVVRFHNIPESSGNVFRLWESLPKDEPLPVTACRRYFTPLEDAVRLLVAASGFPTGRYCVDPGPIRRMMDVAAELYPGREQVRIPPRRGDRRSEPLHAACETVKPYGRYLKIVGAHDPNHKVPTWLHTSLKAA
jgi:FlaA1/EpsC-like NDP-sugar epimerase